jgi:hypothetical protein
MEFHPPRSIYSMDIHGVIGAGWSWMEYLEKVSMSFTAGRFCSDGRLAVAMAALRQL